jgi:hypothetical protein
MHAQSPKGPRSQEPEESCSRGIISRGPVSTSFIKWLLEKEKSKEEEPRRRSREETIRLI